MTTFGSRLKRLREDKGLTQEQLGKVLNVKKAAVSKYENENTSPDNATLCRLADFFSVTVDYLLGRTDDPSPIDDDRQHVNDDDALEYLEELHKRPEMKALFQVGRKATKEDIETAITIIEALKKKGGEEG